MEFTYDKLDILNISFFGKSVKLVFAGINHKHSLDFVP